MSQLLSTACGTIEYDAVGVGPIVLLSHGSPGDCGQGLQLAKCLKPSRLRFLAVSRPGYGSTPLAAGRTPVEQADSFAHLLDGLRIDRAAILGLSGGGPSSLQFAIRHGDRCWALVLLSAVTGKPDPTRPTLLERFASTSFGLWGLRASIRATIPVTKAIAVRIRSVEQLLLLQQFCLTALPDHSRKAGLSNDEEQFATLQPYDLSHVRAPTAVIHGADDRLVPFAHAERVVHAIPSTTLLTIDRGGHFIFATHAAIVFRRVVTFLACHAPVSDEAA